MQSDGKSVNRGLPVLDLARGRDSSCCPKEARSLGTRMGRTYRTGTRAAQAQVEELLLLFLNLYANVQLVKHERDIVSAVIYCYIPTEFHYAKRDSPLSAFEAVGIEVSCFYCKNIKISQLRLKYQLTFFPIHNTSIR